MKTKADLFVDSRCELGEGPFWHPLLERLFWFDILNQTMLSATPDGHIVDRVTFPDRASAAAVIDRDNLAVAVSGMLTRYNLVTDERAPIFPIDASGEAAASEPEAAVDPFAALSVDAGDAADVTDEISSWLSEPADEPGGELPLAVFPSPETDPFEESAIPTEASADIPAAFDMGDADDLHAFAEPNGTAAAGSSHVEVGTGFSGIVSPSEVDAPSDGMAADEWPDADATEATLDDFATDDQPSFDASGFDGVSEAGDAVAPGDLPADDADLDVAAVGAAAATAAVATAVRGRPAARKKGGGIGQVIGIVLGGLMAIPSSRKRRRSSSSFQLVKRAAEF
jgi:hypothetical protein